MGLFSGFVISGSVPHGRVSTVMSTSLNITHRQRWQHCVTRLYLRDAVIRFWGFVLFQRFTGTHHASARDSLCNCWWTEIKLLFEEKNKSSVCTYTNACLHETSQGPVFHGQVQLHGHLPSSKVTLVNLRQQYNEYFKNAAGTTETCV